MILLGLIAIIGVASSVAALVGLLWLRDKIHTSGLPQKWVATINKGRGFQLDQVASAKITVLFDWLVGDAKYIGDAGVSYLVEIEDKKILFDLGDRYGKSNPDPVLHNIKNLGYEPEEFVKKLDAVVISHHHRDHVGGLKAQLGKTFRIPGELEPKCPIYIPKPLSHPILKERISDKPEQLFPGVGLTGPLPAWMFFLGCTPEQMLMINLPEGLLLVVGCGHPDISAMVRYAKEITGRPVYAIFGGIHALLDKSKSFTQRVIAAKNPPWRPITPEDIGIMAVALSDMGVKKIYLSSHDSDEWATNILRTVFNDDLILIRVGDAYKFGDSNS